MTLSGALSRSDSLAGLASRVAESNARFEAVRALLPEPLARELRPGPIDDEGWSVLASNAAVAAKLRHLLPLLTTELRSQSFRDLPIRVRLRSR
jgi:Dna[CI] antecedent, DciA